MTDVSTNESLGYSGFATVVSAHAPESYVVFDTKIRDYVRGNELEFAELVDIGGVTEAATPEAVAEAIGCDPEAVRKALAGYAAAVAGEQADPFGRTDFGLAPLEPPYCVVRSVPVLFHTQGGVTINDEARSSAPRAAPFPGFSPAAGSRPESRVPTVPADTAPATDCSPLSASAESRAGPPPRNVREHR